MAYSRFPRKRRLPGAWQQTIRRPAGASRPPAIHATPRLFRQRLAPHPDVNAVLNAVLPLFSLILVGYISARRRILGKDAIDVLNRFVVWLALPALLFQAMAQATAEQLRQPGYIAATAGAILIVFLVSALLERHRKRRLATISIESLTASYANAGYMGIPLGLMLFGEESLPATVLAVLMTACALFALSIVLIEIDLNGSSKLHQTARKVVMSLLRNPLVMAPVAGALVAASPVTVPGFVFQFTSLLGAAASPCALVTIGLFLAQQQPTAASPAVVGRTVGLKLLLHPLAAYVLAFWVFDMPDVWARTAVILAALPIGTGPFMLAKLYDLDPGVSSRAILLSTLGSVVTLSVLASLLT